MGLRRHRGWLDRPVPKSQCTGFRAWGGSRRNSSEDTCQEQPATTDANRVHFSRLSLVSLSPHGVNRAPLQQHSPLTPHHHIAITRQCLPNANGSPQEAASDTARCSADSGVQVPPGEIKAPRFVHFPSCDTLPLPPFSSFLKTSIFTSWHQVPYIQPPDLDRSPFLHHSPASSRRYPSSSDSLRPQSPWLSARGWPEASPPNWLPTTPPYVVSLSFLGT